jgi:hypothetical protein
MIHFRSVYLSTNFIANQSFNSLLINMKLSWKQVTNIHFLPVSLWSELLNMKTVTVTELTANKHKKL